MKKKDADALKRRILHRLGIRDERYLLESERVIFECIDEETETESDNHDSRKEKWYERMGISDH